MHLHQQRQIERQRQIQNTQDKRQKTKDKEQKTKVKLFSQFSSHQLSQLLPGLCTCINKDKHQKTKEKDKRQKAKPKFPQFSSHSCCQGCAPASKKTHRETKTKDKIQKTKEKDKGQKAKNNRQKAKLPQFSSHQLSQLLPGLCTCINKDK